MKSKVVKILLFIVCIVIIFVLSLLFWVNSNIKKEQIPVLMYHQVIPEDLITDETDTITTTDFEKQMKYLSDNGYKTLTLDEFLCWKQNKCKLDKKTVLLTFDDGFYSVYHYAKPILEKYNFNASVFLLTSLIPDETKEFKKGEYGLIGYDVIDKDDTLEYGSHTYNMHRYINDKQAVLSMSYDEINKDLINSNKNYKTKYLAYPYNTDTDDFIKALKNNDFSLAFRGESEKCTKTVNNYQIPRIGVSNDFESFKNIFETTKHNNKYGNGILRKIFVTIERKLK